MDFKKSITVDSPLGRRKLYLYNNIHNNKNSIIVSMNNFSMNKSDSDRKYTFVSDLPMPINSSVCCDKNITDI